MIPPKRHVSGYPEQPFRQSAGDPINGMVSQQMMAGEPINGMVSQQLIRTTGHPAVCASIS